jgi:YrbI family 3-deoxy-D-manno-octulosonate 8-phosphate phosphatase
MIRIAETEISAEMSARLQDVALLVFDFDGVWTTNQVLVMQDGTEGVLANRSDGLGIGMLRESGLDMMVLSAEVNPVVTARCNKVKMLCVQGEKDKAAALRRILAEKKIDASRVAYVGNDVNDVPCMNMVGVPIAVADSWPTVLPHAKLVTQRIGGHGAVREVCEWFLAARQAKSGADGRWT